MPQPTTATTTAAAAAAAATTTITTTECEPWNRSPGLGVPESDASTKRCQPPCGHLRVVRHDPKGRDVTKWRTAGRMPPKTTQYTVRPTTTSTTPFA